MATVIIAGNATTGLSLSADNAGSFEFKTGTGAGTTALTLSSSQIATFSTGVGLPTGQLYPLVSGTAQASTSGTSIDFTGIPSWVKRITVMFNGVSTNGTSIPIIQLGDAGGIENTGYAGTAWLANTTNVAMSSGFSISGASDATYVFSGTAIITLLGSNAWTAFGSISLTNSSAVTLMSGAKTLSATLDRIRITTVAGTNTFDAGSINILYE
jgi:hypothetical protein